MLMGCLAQGSFPESALGPQLGRFPNIYPEIRGAEDSQCCLPSMISSLLAPSGSISVLFISNSAPLFLLVTAAPQM